MNAERLLEFYDRVAEAPDAISGRATSTVNGYTVATQNAKAEKATR